MPKQYISVSSHTTNTFKWPLFMWANMSRKRRVAYQVGLGVVLLVIVILVVVLLLVQEQNKQSKIRISVSAPNTTYIQDVGATKPLTTHDVIPKYIIRTGEKDYTELASEITGIYQQCEEQGWETKYFSSKQRRTFLCEHFDRRVVTAYDKLIPNSYRADLFRFCAVYVLGGIYVDFSTAFVVPIESLVDVDNDELVLCQDFEYNNKKHMYTAFFAARPRHELMKMCVDAIVSNVHVSFKGVNALHPTGPLVFQEVFDMFVTKYPTASYRLELTNGDKNMGYDRSGTCVIKFKSQNHTFLVSNDGKERQVYGNMWRDGCIYHGGEKTCAEYNTIHLELVHITDPRMSEMPRHVIYAGLDNGDPKIISAKQRLFAANPTWTSKELPVTQHRQFIERHFDANVLFAYDHLAQPSNKLDLFRYCAVYRLGGLLIDPSFDVKVPFDEIVDITQDPLVLCHGQYVCGFMTLCPSFFGCVQHHPFFRKCIEAIVSNVRLGKRGLSNAHVTGAQLLRDVYDSFVEDTTPHRLLLNSTESGIVAIDNADKVFASKLRTNKIVACNHMYDQLQVYKPNMVNEGIIFYGIDPSVTLIPCGLATVRPYQTAFNGSVVDNTYAVRMSSSPFAHNALKQQVAVFDWNNGSPVNGRIVPFVTQTGFVEDPCCVSLHGRPVALFNDTKHMYTGYLDTAECFVMRPPNVSIIDHDGREKNWAPFVYDDVLHVLYGPGHVVVYDKGVITKEYRSDPPVIKGLNIRGGTQLVPWKGRLISIFHTQTKRFIEKQKHWEYSAGVIEFEASPPFRALRWSRKPLWTAAACSNEYARSFLLVTFPRHLEISFDGVCTILAGFHDVTDVILTVPVEHLLACIE